MINLAFSWLVEGTLDRFEALIQRAACVVDAAAIACRDWEDGGDTGPVSDTAWAADEATAEAIEAVADIDPALTLDSYPETRLGRLVMATRLLVLAGTDEGGTSLELDLASTALVLAAEG